MSYLVLFVVKYYYKKLSITILETNYVLVLLKNILECIDINCTTSIPVQDKVEIHHKNSATNWRVKLLPTLIDDRD